MYDRHLDLFARWVSGRDFESMSCLQRLQTSRDTSPFQSYNLQGGSFHSGVLVGLLVEDTSVHQRHLCSLFRHHTSSFCWCTSHQLGSKTRCWYTVQSLWALEEYHPKRTCHEISIYNWVKRTWMTVQLGHFKPRFTHDLRLSLSLHPLMTTLNWCLESKDEVNETDTKL